MCNCSYVQMLAAIDAEMQRQVAPFLLAGIQPDIVLLENEGSAGCLYEIKLPNGDSYSRCGWANMQFGLHSCDVQIMHGVALHH